MKRTIAIALVVMLLVIALLPGTRSVTGQAEVPPAPETKFYRSENPLPGQYLAMLRNNIFEQSATAIELAQQYDGQLLQSPYSPGVNGFSVRMTEVNAQALSQDDRVEYVQEIPASGFPRLGSGTNVALASNGGQAFASSTLNSDFPVSAIINGDRRGTNWAAGTGGWHDATGNSFPDYLEIHFNGEKRINEIDFFTLQDNFNNPAEPTQEMTFSQYGVTSFRLNYWDSAAGQWVMLAQVQDNNQVWRTVKFPTVVTPKLSIMLLNGGGGFSRVVEIEAWEAPQSTNVALASNGGQAFASSTLSNGFPASALINGERQGTGWAAGTGGWHDATGNSFPDYLEIHFNGEKRINEIDFITLQDNFNEPVEPTPDMTFSQYGVTAFRINYWNSASAQWVMLTEIQGNNQVWRTVDFPTIKTPKLSIMVLNGADNYSRVVEIEAWEEPAPTNVALASNGGQAFASSTLNSNFPVSAIVNGERNGSGWGAGTGGWNDATANTFPDYLELHFDGEKIIHQVDFFTLQDDLSNPVAPSLLTTFAQYGVTAFRINYWNSAASQWVMLKEIQGNNNVWRRVEFEPIQTSKLSIMLLNGVRNYSRVVEIEVWGASVPPAIAEDTEEPTPTPGETSVDGQFASALPPNSNYILRKAANGRYFSYADRTTALLGISGSYVPHIARNRTKNGVYDPVKENCTYDDLNYDGIITKKYKKCIQLIKNAGLNHFQIWAFLNHSLGRLPIEGPNPNATPAPEGVPYPNEQPFTYTENKWNLNAKRITDTNPDNDREGFDNTFFQRLREVVEHAQNQGIMVGIVLFDPWSGEKQFEPTRSPWYAANNRSNLDPGQPASLGFSDRTYFVKAENPNGNPAGTPGTPIDTTYENRTLRSIQVALMKKLAFELKHLKNFYWVLANEPDIDARSQGMAEIVWHKYMARTLRQYEDSLPGSPRHLIAANLTINIPSPPNAPRTDVINALRAETVNGQPIIDIITSHYVHFTTPTAIRPNTTRVQAINRYGAIRLLNDFNLHDLVSGNPTAENNKIWGFTEDVASGYPGDTSLKTDGVRAEAWEFFMNGGGLFDHLSYSWGNPDSNQNHTQANRVREQLGYLGKFMDTLTLDGMRRLMPNATSGWIQNPPTYNSPFWAAMSRPRTGTGTSTKYETFLFYAHRSTLTNMKYDAYSGSIKKSISFTVRNLGAAGCYHADWYYPSGKTPDGGSAIANGALKSMRTDKIQMQSTTSTKQLTSPLYLQDILLKITWVKTGSCPS